MAQVTWPTGYDWRLGGKGQQMDEMQAVVKEVLALLMLVAGTSIGFVESFAQARGIAHLSAWTRRVGGLLVAPWWGYLVWTA